MTGERGLVTAAGIVILACLSPVMGDEGAGVRPEPGIRLLSLQITWTDQEGAPASRDHAPVERALDSQLHLRQVERDLTQILSQVGNGDRSNEVGNALVLVPGIGNTRGYYAVASIPGDAVGGRTPRIESVIGTRTSDRSGTLHTLNLTRTAALPEPAREEVGRLVDLRMMGGKVYWEAAFELTDLHCDEIDSLHALGPGLIKSPKNWVNILGEALETPAAALGTGSDSCMGFGPIRLCMSVPRVARLLAARRPIKERTKVRLTNALWHKGNSCGVGVLGRLLDYSVLTFRVRTNGKGSLPAGVTYLPPFDVGSAAGRLPPGNDPRPGKSFEDVTPPPEIRARVDWRDREIRAVPAATAIAAPRTGCSSSGIHDTLSGRAIDPGSSSRRRRGDDLSRWAVRPWRATAHGSDCFERTPYFGLEPER